MEVNKFIKLSGRLIYLDNLSGQVIKVDNLSEQVIAG